MDDKDTCTICFEIFTHPKILECGHTFCFQCLKNYTDERYKGQDLFCPLCRTKWKIPKGGLSHLSTNYFVEVSKLDSREQYCNSCRKGQEMLSICNTCGSYFCIRCFGKHFHSQAVEEDIDDDEDDSHEFGLPIDPRFKRIKTQYDCIPKNYFVVETPVKNRNQHPIYSIRMSIYGGLYVVAAGVEFILKYDETGKILDKIRTPFQCFGIEECANGSSLLAVFLFEKVILRYEKSFWCNFATCGEFYPSDIVEVSNGSILACGTSNLQSNQIQSSKQIGYLQMYSSKGEPLLKLDKIISKTEMLVFPHKLAYNKEIGCIAVADQGTNSVAVLKEDGSSYKIYRSQNAATLSIPFLGIEHSLSFHVTGLCADSNGQFIIATPEGCLHFIDSSAEMCGVAMTNAEDCFGRVFPHVDRDRNGIIWCSDSLFGTIKTFETVRYRNKLNPHNHDNDELLGPFIRNII